MTRFATHLIHANVLVDVVERSPQFAASSAATLVPLLMDGAAAINQIVYAEVLAGLDREADFATAFGDDLVRLDLPWEAAWHAGQAHRRYRQRGGAKASPMPDFYIGAHALISGLTLVTRDATRYETYFPTLNVVTPG